MSAGVLALVVVAGILAVHLTLGRYNAGRVLREWRTALYTDVSSHVSAVQRHVDVEAACLDDALAGARGAESRSDLAEARRFLLLARDAIDGAVPDRLARLAAMAKLCRMAAAMVPAPPVDWSAFRLRRAAGVSGLGALAHHLLVSTHERFWLRLQIVRIVLAIAADAIRSSTRRGPGASASALDLFEQGAHDWKAGDQELVSSLRILLMSLAARPVGSPQRAAS